MHFTYLTIKAVVALTVTVLSFSEPIGFAEVYTAVLWCISGAFLVQGSANLYVNS